MKILESNRIFKPWIYTVSHSMLVLRSSYEACLGEDTNIDLYFSDVVYMALPSKLKGLLLEEDSEGKESNLLQRYSPTPSDYKVFSLTSGGERYIIIAYSVEVDTNKLGFMELGYALIQASGPEDP
jgi:hypothetical protein